MSKSNIAHRASEISSNYIVSTRTVANKPNSRLCPVKAQWFTIPQAIVKTLLLVSQLNFAKHDHDYMTDISRRFLLF